MITTYECEQCGTEVVVTRGKGSKLRPIYCCGTEIPEKSPAQKMSVKKKAVKKTAKVSVKQKTTKAEKNITVKNITAAKNRTARK